MQCITLGLILGNKISLGAKTLHGMTELPFSPCLWSASRSVQCKAQARLFRCSQLFPVFKCDSLYMLIVYAHRFRNICSARIRIATTLHLTL